MAKKEKQVKLPKYVNKEVYQDTIDKLNTLTRDNETYNVGIDYKNKMPSIVDSTKNKLQNNEDITQLFPDIDLAIQIMTSSILAPNDMMTTNLIYNRPNIKIPSEINSFLLDTIKNYIKDNYNISNKLATIIKESLFTKGAYVEAIIPSSTLDDINPYTKDGEVSIEGYVDDLDNAGEICYVKDSDIEISVEELGGIKIPTDELHLDIIDNINILRAKEDMLLSIESGVTNTKEHKDLSVLFAPDDRKKTFNVNLAAPGEDIPDRTFIDLSNGISDTDKYMTKPLILKLPVESVIPVHATGDPSHHIGYFIMLDEKGVPVVTNIHDPSLTQEVDDLIGKPNDNKLNIIKKAKSALYGITKKDPTLTDVENLYSVLITNRIKKALANGKYGDVVDINENGDVYRTVLHRSLKKQKTRLLYIPNNNLTYYAFEYRENGTGKSLLEKSSVLFSIRSIVLFTRLMANIKNSTTTTEVTATLDDNDTEPEKTMEHIISEALKTRQTQLPLGVTKIDDLVDWTHKVGFKFNFKGPGLPDMDISVDDTNTSKVVPDTDLDEMIQEHIIMSFGLSKDMVMSGYDPEFATTVVANNILLAKRVNMLQDVLNPQISKHVSRLLNNDPIISKNIKNIIKDNVSKIRKYLYKTIPTGQRKQLSNTDAIVDYIFYEYVNNLEITLPRPAVQETENLKEAFDKYLTSLDDYLELLISEEALPEDFSGDINDKLDDIKSILKTVLAKKWMSENNYIPEINEFLTINDEGKPSLDLFEMYNEYLEALNKSILPFIKLNKKIVDKNNDKLDNIEEEEDDEIPKDVDSSTNDTTDDIDDPVDDTVSEDKPASGDTDDVTTEPTDDQTGGI